MKKIMVLVWLVISFPAFSQPGVKASPKKVKVGEVKEKGTLIAGLYYQVTGKDTTYFLTYINQKDISIADIQSISFSGKDKGARTLYDLLDSFFGDPEKQEDGYKLKTKIGMEEVVISLKRIMDIQSLMIVTSKGFFYLNNKQLTDLFYPYP